MTHQRISQNRRYVATSLGLLLALATGCGSAEEGPSTTMDQEPSKLSELSRPLDPTLAVDEDDELGTSYDDMLEEATLGATLSTGGSSSCTIDHYMADDLVVAVNETCSGYYRRAMLFGDGPQGPQSLQFVFGDFDSDGRIDGWFDPAIGFALEDVDSDGVADRSRTTASHIDPEVVSDFAEGWTAPEYLDEYVREDTDGDGRYDLETIIAGTSPDGEPAYWVEN